MYKISFIGVSIFLSVIFITCEEPKEIDNTPPTVIISYPMNETIVSEIVTIRCMSSDDEGVEKVELWVDGLSTGLIDKSEPYSFDWNTTSFEDGSHTIIVRSYDINDNNADSDPIILIVDNSGSYPKSVNIISIVFENGVFTIIWNKSSDEDFDSYYLEKSDISTMDEYEVVFNTEEINDTSYVDTDIDPLNYQYYRISVSDTLGYETKGQIFSSSLDPIPTAVNITSVTYTLDALTVEWESSIDGDFQDYKILYSLTETGPKDTIVTYTDVSTTSHNINTFDPSIENWFWVLVTDTLGQSSVGVGKTNKLESPPTESILRVAYNNEEFIVTWSKNPDSDFASYKLYESSYEDMNGKTLIYETTTVTDTIWVVTGISNNERIYYQIFVTDSFGIETSSSIIAGSSYPKIVFFSDRDDKNQIYIMDIDGLNQINLSNNTGYSEQYPQFSPDGSRIVFQSVRDVQSQIYIMNADGSNQMRLSNNEGWDDDPKVSHDGLKVTFQSRLDNQYHISVVDIDGKNETILTSGSSNLHPQISADGSRVVFQSQRDGNWEVYIVDSDGNNEINLTNNVGDDSFPRFSPDGSNIIFYSNRDGNSEVYIMDIDGSNQINLTQNSGGDAFPQFTPDGSRIVFGSSRDGNGEIYIMDFDGNNQIRLTNSIGNEKRHEVSPNGSKITYQSDRDGNEEIYIIDIDGSNESRLTNNSHYDLYPQFQP